MYLLVDVFGQIHSVYVSLHLPSLGEALVTETVSTNTSC